MERLETVVGCLGLLAAVALLAGCSGGSSQTEVPAEATGKRLSGHGITIELPPSWDGRIADRGFPLSGAAIAHVANFSLPASDDDWATKARRAMGKAEVLLVLSEGLLDRSFAQAMPRIEPGVRLAAVDHRFAKEYWFAENGRAFVLDVVFGSRLPSAKLIRRVDTVLGSFSIERRMRPLRPAPDPAPARALAPTRLAPTPLRILNQCRLAQARSSFPLLCPVRLPRPFVAWPRGDPPTPAAERLPAPGVSWRSRSDPRYRKRTFSGVSIGYGAPWEPDSGPDWRIHLWRNRPCCFLHFEVFWRKDGPRYVPAGARSATLEGRRGLLKDATSYGVASRENDYLYWANHTRFLWRENGVPYVATLHRFGTKQETRALLGQLLRQLRPVRQLFLYRDVLATPPAEAVAPVRLFRLPEEAVRVCKRMQAPARFPVLCPARLPRATLGFRLGASPPRLRARVVGNVREPLKGELPHGVDVSYSAPVEPQSGRGWRKLVWHNRPCCLLHFTVWRRGSGDPRLPPGARPAILGGKRGLLVEATGHGLRPGTGFYWANHTWFSWRQGGVPYAASLHYFGRRETLALLDRLIRELRPANALR